MTKPSDEATIQANGAILRDSILNPPRELITPGLQFTCPTFRPYCAYCNMPTERYYVEMPKDAYRVSIDAQCCGKHQGAHVRIEELRQVINGGGKFYCIIQPGRYRYQGVSGESVRVDASVTA